MCKYIMYRFHMYNYNCLGLHSRPALLSGLQQELPALLLLLPFFPAAGKRPCRSSGAMANSTTQPPSFSPSPSSSPSPSPSPSYQKSANKFRELSDKVVVITGISKGLGRSLAIELAKRGLTVVGCARNDEKLSELEKLLRDTGSSKHLLKKVDVTSDSGVEEFAKLVVQTKGAPDIIVNNAGIINRSGKIWELSASEFDTVIDVNVKGVANVMRHFIPLMKQGTLVNITSGWGRIGAADVTPYCASKWAIEGLTQAVAKEVPPGIAVVALNPGVINTDMLTICFGSQASLYPSPDTWAPLAADAILGLTSSDNAASLNV